MVLSPQAFHNVNVTADIFNHCNINFWEYAQHGYDALGFISCTGVLHGRSNQMGVCGSMAELPASSSTSWCETRLGQHRMVHLPADLRGQLCCLGTPDQACADPSAIFSLPQQSR